MGSHHDVASLRAYISALFSDISHLNSSPCIWSCLVEPLVNLGLQFSGEAKAINGFLITIYDVMEANVESFSSNTRKVSWVSCHLLLGSPAHDWWISQLQENARAFTCEHPDVPRLDGTYSAAGVLFILPILSDISLFAKTLAKIFLDPYDSQTALKELQSLTRGNLPVFQFNVRFTALAFRDDASEAIFMDYYRMYLSPLAYC